MARRAAGRPRWLAGVVGGVVLTLSLAAGPARGAELPTHVDGLEARFDHTLRLSAGIRTDAVDDRIGTSPVFTAGEHRVERGGLTASRLDLLSELDLSYDGRLGLRVSAAGWYDLAYRDGTPGRDPSLAAVPGTYVGGRYSSTTLDRYRGPWGEVLDAFVFARFAAGPVPVALKAGRHTVAWGESLMLPGATHGISYAQAPLDLQKGFALPGTEAKELFRPLANVSAQAQLTETLSLAAQVFLEWQPSLLPEGGTFLGAGDFAFSGPDGVFRRLAGQPAFLANAGISWPSDAGEWGASLRWRPERLDGALGLHLRRFTDKLPAVLLTANPGGEGPMSPALPSPFRYTQYFAEDAWLAGLSLSRQVLGASLGADLSVRWNAPLLAQSLGFAVAPAPPLAAVLFPTGAPREVGNSFQARGETLHGVLNATGVVTAGRAVSTLSWAVEATYSRWLRVTENEDLFFGEGYGVCREDPALAAAGLARTERDGCATREHLGLAVGLTPAWFRVASGVDLSAPLSLGWTPYGNSPVTFGGNEGAGTFSAAVAADLWNRARAELRYVDFFGRIHEAGGTVTSANGQQALLASRGSVTLTVKSTF